MWAPDKPLQGQHRLVIIWVYPALNDENVLIDNLTKMRELVHSGARGTSLAHPSQDRSWEDEICKGMITGIERDSKKPLETHPYNIWLMLAHRSNKLTHLARTEDHSSCEKAGVRKKIRKMRQLIYPSCPSGMVKINFFLWGELQDLFA